MRENRNPLGHRIEDGGGTGLVVVGDLAGGGFGEARLSVKTAPIWVMGGDGGVIFF